MAACRWLALCLTVALWAAPAQAGKNLALIIANQNYKDFGDAGDAFDATLANDALRAADFEIRTIRNLNRKGLSKVAAGIRADIAAADRVIVFLSGHVVSTGRESWLLTTDAKRQDGLLVGAYGLPIHMLTDLLADKAGAAVLLVGHSAAVQRLANGLDYGYAPAAIPQGVTVFAGRTGDLVTVLREHLLRVRPETLCRITEFSEHESNGRELDEGERVAVEVLPVLGQSAAAVEPGDGAFDHPTPGLDDEALHPIGSLDDLGLEIGQDAGQGAVKDRPLIGAVGEQFPEKGKQTEQGRQQRETAVAILNVGGGDDAVQQQALRIDQNMPLLALDQLAGIEAVAVDASPPFSALFTL